MPRYIALLGGINVGGHNVKMADLRTLFEELGFTNVATFIASGNVIFDSPNDDAASLEAAIEAHLKTALGYAVPTLLRTPEELAAVVARWPFEESDRANEAVSLCITFLKNPASDETRQKLRTLNSATDALAAEGREMYWLCRGKISDSPLASGVQFRKTLGPSSGGETTRNATTVRKLAAKTNPAG